MRRFLLNALIALFVFTFNGKAQNDNILNRLSVIEKSGVLVYNIDNITITKETFHQEFTKKSLKRIYKRYSIKRRDEKTQDENLEYPNYSVQKEYEYRDGLIENESFYFIKKAEQQIEVVYIATTKPRNKQFEYQIIDLIIQDQIPDSIYSSLNTDTIKFAGRDIILGNNCYWMNINNVQCPYYGQMNWSVHATRESAITAINHQLRITKSKWGGKVISEEMIEAEFEGVPTKVKKVIYKPNGFYTFLMGGGRKTLTIYYVAEKVRGNYISCVLSHWSNDRINPSGLPPLLEKVMNLKD